MRHIIDAAGQSWRGFLLLAAIELAGGDIEEYRLLFGAAELLHSGSLIIDDVQDNSDPRWGVPTGSAPLRPAATRHVHPGVCEEGPAGPASCRQGERRRPAPRGATTSLAGPSPRTPIGAEPSSAAADKFLAAIAPANRSRPPE